MTRTLRVAARTLLVDAEDRLLLMHERRDIGGSLSHWITPGGGVEAGETLAQAAVRELHEETGIELSLAPDAVPVHRDVVSFSFAGADYEQTNHYLFARCSAGLVVAPAAQTEVERLVVIGWKWWTLDELAESDVVREPVEVVDIVRTLLAQEGAP